MKINKRDIIVSFLAILLMVIISYLVDLSEQEKSDKIDKNKGITTGVIVKYDKWGTANRGADYEFVVDSITYKGKTGNAPYFNNCLKDNSCIGKKFKVEYSKIDPNISRILFDEFIE